MQELIKITCFTENWLKSKAQELSGNPVLVEKTIHAFALLGCLVQVEKNLSLKAEPAFCYMYLKLKDYP